ncbi:MAG: hypothetical protein EXQ85_06175 [Alphaproteobacteria bacterium]|nr:hypothetical protein [Alphaproteobacteria bacterium]
MAESEPKEAIIAFLVAIVAAIEDVRRLGANDEQAIALALNARGVTTRRGRRWSAASVRKFLASPGAKRLLAPTPPSN